MAIINSNAIDRTTNEAVRFPDIGLYVGRSIDEFINDQQIVHLDQMRRIDLFENQILHYVQDLSQISINHNEHYITMECTRTMSSIN